MILKKLFKRKHKEVSSSENQTVNLENNTPQLIDLFSPDGLEINTDYLMLGPSRYSRVYVAAIYPRQVNIGWLDRIFALGDVDLSVHVDPAPNRAVVVDLTKKVSQARAMHMLMSKNGNLLSLPELEQIIRDLETIRSDIQTNRDKLFYISVFITIHARSLEELNIRSDNLEDILAAGSTQVRALMFRQLEGLISNMPINNINIGDYWRNVTTGGLAAMMPVANSDLSHPSGIWFGFNYHSGAPMFYDAFIGPPHLNNQHMSVFGGSGSGKSVALKTIAVLRPAAQGKRILILDPEGEYSRLVEKLIGGSVVRITNNDVTGINPLDLEADIDDFGRKSSVNINDKVNELCALFSAMMQSRGRAMGLDEMAIMEEAIRDSYAEKKITTDPKSLYVKAGQEEKSEGFAVGKIKKTMPIFSDVYRHLEGKPNSNDLLLLLKPFLRDGTLGMFDCQSTVDLKAQVISFDFSRINDNFTRFYAMYVLLGWAWQKFAQGITDADKIIVIDESWWFMQYKDSAGFLKNLSKRGRKYRTSLVVASQQIEDFLSSEEGRAVIGNAETLLLLRQNAALVDDVAEAFKLSGGCREYLRTFRPGEAIVRVGGNITAVKITPTPFEWQWVQTVRDWKEENAG